MPAGARRSALEGFEDGRLEFLFLAPEQFADAARLDELRSARPSLLVVDEAHCISAWGTTSDPTTYGSARWPTSSGARWCSP